MVRPHVVYLVHFQKIAKPQQWAIKVIWQLDTFLSEEGLKKTRNTVVWEKKNRKGQYTDHANVFKIINVDREECEFHLHM